MRKTITVSTALGVALFATPALAQFEDDELPGDLDAEPEPESAPESPMMSSPTGVAGPGDFGVGFETTLAGLAGVAGRYQMNEDLGLYGVLAVSIATEDGFSDNIALGAGATWRLKAFEQGGISAVGGIDIGRSENAGTMLTATVIALEAGLQADWFIDPRLSVHAQVGAAFALLTGDAGGADASGTAITVGGETLTSFGATYWFR